MMPTEVAGSRLPVGSSAIRIIGRLTKARATATRCCSPPDSSSGIRSPLPSSPTSSRVSGTRLRISEAPLPMTCSAKATFSETVLFGSSRKSWKTVPIWRRSRGTFQRGEPVDLLAGHVDPAAGGPRLAQHQPQEGGLARAGGADEEDELALLDVDCHVVEGGSALTGVGLDDLLEANHRIESSRIATGVPETAPSGVALQCRHAEARRRRSRRSRCCWRGASPGADAARAVAPRARRRPAPTTLESYDTAGVDVARGPFCDRVSPTGVEHALGDVAAPTARAGRTATGIGSPTAPATGRRSTAAGGPADERGHRRAWVFVPPVSRGRARSRDVVQRGAVRRRLPSAHGLGPTSGPPRCAARCRSTTGIEPVVARACSATRGWSAPSRPGRPGRRPRACQRVVRVGPGGRPRLTRSIGSVRWTPVPSARREVEPRDDLAAITSGRGPASTTIPASSSSSGSRVSSCDSSSVGGMKWSRGCSSARAASPCRRARCTKNVCSPPPRRMSR